LGFDAKFRGFIAFSHFPIPYSMAFHFLQH
jgi:hypothetical protein